MIKLSEMIDESEASDEARRLGLDYLKFGRWGQDGKVTHVTKNGKLVPADQKVGEPHPSHGAAARNVTRGRPSDEMPEPEYPIKYKQGAQSSTPTPQPAPAPDVNKLSSMVPSKPAGTIDWDTMDYTQQETAAEQLYQDLASGNKIDTTGMSPEDKMKVRRAENSFYNAKDNLEMSLDDEMPDRMSDFVVAAMEYDDARSLAKTSPVGQPSTPEDPNANLRATPLKKVAAGDYGDNTDRPQASRSVDPFSEEGYYQAFDVLSKEPLPPTEFASFIKPYMSDAAQAKKFFSHMLDSATYDSPDEDGYDVTSNKHNIIMNAGMALKVLRRLEDLKGPNVNSLSSMIPNRTPDQLKDPEDFAKNRQF